MQTRRSIALVVLTSALLAGCAGQDWREVSGVLTGDSGEPDTRTVAAGLKEALRVGARRTVDNASREGGYLDDPEIRISLPPEFESMANTLRRIGLGGQLDSLETRMNRAAEKAAAEATPVLVDAISSMSFADAREVLSGGDTAATDYLRGATSGELRTRYSPIVDKQLQDLGVVQLYESLHDRYQRIPMMPALDFTPRDYVTDRALDGLFKLLADEEKRIRENPAARTTALLRKVFGQ